MFFIFGWNRPIVTKYGAVQQHKCPNCADTDFWQLNKISRYITLFFIPVIPQDSKYWYHCPICNHGLQVNAALAKNYKPIAALNSSYLEKMITEAEWVIKLEDIYKLIDQKTEVQGLENVAESEIFKGQVASKTTEELFQILKFRRSDYTDAFIIAAEAEIKSRNLN